MDTAEFGGKKSYWHDFSFRVVKSGFIFICFLGFAAGILFYLRDSNNFIDSLGANREKANTANANAVSGPQMELIFPPDNYLTSSVVTPDIFYTWKNPFSYPILFQIATRSDFAGGILVEDKLYGAAIQDRFLPPGVYYWRVSAEEPSSGGSPSKRIDTQPRRIVILPSYKAPEIYTPREGENIRISDGIPLDFRWEKLNYADTYDFKLFSVGSSVPLYEVSSLRDTVVQAYFSPWTVGRFHWTVQANTEAMNEITRKRSLIQEHYFSIGASGASPVSGFVRGVIKAGAIHAPITLLNPWVGVSFVDNPSSRTQARWSVDENLINTRIIFSRDQDPAADPKAVILYIDEGETSISLPALGEGIWYWIVQGDTPGGQGLSAAAPSWFTILAQPPLDSPSYLQPGEGDVITLSQLTIDRSISFLWEDVSEADAYIFSLFETGHEKMLISGSPILDTSFILTDLAILTGNDYTWQVEAVTVNRDKTIGRRGVIKRSSFTVHVPQSDNLRTIRQGTIYGY